MPALLKNSNFHIRSGFLLSLALIIACSSLALAQSTTSEKLATVTGISIQPAKEALIVNWNKVPGADNYTIRWGTNGKYTNYSNAKGNIYNPTTNTYTITGLSNNTTYNVSIAARNSTNTYTKGDYSQGVKATPSDVVLDRVTGVMVKYVNKVFIVSWNKVSGADNYTIRWGTNGKYTNYSNAKGNIYNPTTNTYTITGLTENTSYGVSVGARNSIGLLRPGAYSVDVIAFTTAPAPSTTTTTTTLAPTTTTTQPVITPNTFIDNFANSLIDVSSWKVYHNNYGSGNNELQCLTPNNVSPTNGTLKIVAKSETLACKNYGTYNYTSGFLGSREAGKYYPRYGTFEMRAKVPHGHATWPAFWLRHRNGSTAANGAEVDIMEYFHAQVPGRTTSTLHLAGQKNTYKKTTYFENPTLSPGWHTWSVTIAPVSNGVKFQFLVDGKDAGSYVDTNHTKWSSSAPENATWDIALNMAVGGNWNGIPGQPIGLLGNGSCAQGGTAPNNCTTTNILESKFPVTYEIDYVTYKPL